MLFSIKKHSLLVTVLLLLVFIIQGVYAGIFVPMSSEATNFFNLEPKAIHYAVLIYSLGSIIGALLAGFLTDIFGRKYFLLFGALALTAGLLTLGTVTDQILLMLSGFLSGFSVGIIITIVRSICIDIYKSNEISNIGPLFIIMRGVGVLLAALSIKYLMELPVWKNFILFGLALLIFLFGLGVFLYTETMPKRKSFAFHLIYKNSLEVLLDKNFMILSFIGASMFIIPTALYSIGISILSSQLNQSIFTVKLINIELCVAFLFGAFLAFLLGKYFNRLKIIEIFVYTVFILLLISFFLNALLPPSLYIFIFIGVLMFLMSGALATLAFTESMSYFHKFPGTSSAVLYSIYLFIPMLTFFILQPMQNFGIQGLHFVYLLTSFCNLSLVIISIRKRIWKF